MFAVLHLGGWDFHCCVVPYSGDLPYAELKTSLFEALKQASAAQVIVSMNRQFGDQGYNLQNLFAEERHRIMRLLTQGTLTRLDQLYTQVYRDNYGVLMAFHRDELPVPQELQVAAEIALSQRVLQTLRTLEQETDETPLGAERIVNLLNDLDTIATETKHLHCQFTLPEARQILERLTVQSLWSILHQTDLTVLQTDIFALKRLLQLGDRLRLGVSLAPAQELYLQYLERYEIPTLMPQVLQSGDEPQALAQTLLHMLQQLGKILEVEAL
jgi:alpha-amylase/alpha-mannosidase (GH57 family)